MKKENYFVAAGVTIAGFAAYYFLKNRKVQPSAEPIKESERHHLTTAFAKAKQVAVGK
jgi:hypothetical protein